jgi:hypothetical protein
VKQILIGQRVLKAASGNEVVSRWYEHWMPSNKTLIDKRLEQVS